MKRILALAALGGAAVLALGPAAAASAADTPLGGFTITSLAEASTASYDQPNAPVPATPTVELDEGYATATDNFGPTGGATASSLYPGQVIANAGPELGAFVPGVPLPAAPVWPIQAQSTYPQSPSSAADDQPGVTMEASSGPGGNTATSELGNATTGTPSPCAGYGSAGGAGLPTLPGLPSVPSLPGSGTPGLAATSALAQIQGSSGTSSSTTAGGVATAAATATDTCVAVLGGLITLGSVTSTATATSDGTSAKLAGSTTVQGASIAGQPVTIDGSGIHAAGQGSPTDPALPVVEKALGQLGITMTVSNPTDAVQGPRASRRLDGLRIVIDLTTLDKQAQSFSNLLPPTVVAQLPLPVPNKQVLVWDLGTVDAEVAASPGFTTTASSGDPAPAAAAGPGANLSGAATASPAGTAGAAGTAAAYTPGATAGTTGVGAAGTAAGGGSGGGSGAQGSGGSGARPATDTASTVPLAFKGIGAGLVLLGLLGAGALGFAALRANAVTEASDGGACADPVDGEPGTGSGEVG